MQAKLPPKTTTAESLESASSEDDTRPLVARKQAHKARCLAVLAAAAVFTAGVIRAPNGLHSSHTPYFVRRKNTTAVYFGNGCFWERQWAYYNVELTFGRRGEEITSKVGYAGGRAPADAGLVCYNTGDARDYTTLGHAEVVQVLLDDAEAGAQVASLARDFFDSFTGPAGRRARPDQYMDAGRPYRSVVGLPGGTRSALYPKVVSANTHGMRLATGGDADELNVVWVLDTDAFPFYGARVVRGAARGAGAALATRYPEVPRCPNELRAPHSRRPRRTLAAGEQYHQFHSNFFQSEGMVDGMHYPNRYRWDLWELQKASGRVEPTGCPERDHH